MNRTTTGRPKNIKTMINFTLRIEWMDKKLEYDLLLN